MVWPVLLVALEGKVVSYEKIGLGILAFIVGYAFIFILQYIEDPIITALADSTTDPISLRYGFESTIVNLGWMISLALRFISLIVIPLALILIGLNTESSKQKEAGLMVAAVWLFFGLAGMAIIWNMGMITELISFLTHSYTKTMFWIGLVGVFIGGIIMPPVKTYVDNV